MVVGASDVGVGEGDEDWAATSEEGDGCDSDVPVNEAEAAAEESLRQWQHTDEETEQGSNQRRSRLWRYAGGTHLAGHWTTVQGRRRKLLPAEKGRRMALWYHCSAWRQVSAGALLVPARHRRWSGRWRPALWRSGLLAMKRETIGKSQARR